MERFLRRDLVNEKLIQHGMLPKADSIKNPEALDEKTLRFWLDFARELVRAQNFTALAFTELKPQVLDYLGFGKNLPPRVIFYREEVKEPGVLILNPTVDVPLFKNPKVSVLEGCGSIDFGRSLYFIKRPSIVTLNGFFYDGHGRAKKDSYEPGDVYLDRSIHEIDHLDGKTAMDFPNLFMDPRRREDWQEIVSEYSNLQEDFIRDFLKEKGPEGIIVYDKVRRKFVHINPSEVYKK